MHFSRLLYGLLPVLASGAVIPHSESTRLDGPPTQKAIDRIEIAPSTGIQGAKRIRLTYGPFQLRSQNDKEQVGSITSMDAGGTAYYWMAADDFPRDITILEGITMTQTTNRQPADLKQQLYNHHSIIMHQFDQPVPSVVQCSGNKTADPVFFSVIAGGANEEGAVGFWSVDRSVSTGYYLPAGAKLGANLDVVNYKQERQQILLAVEVEYLPGKQPNYLHAMQVLLEPGICGGIDGKNVHMPKDQKKFEIKSSGMSMTQDGYFLRSRGHLHDGGVGIQLKINGQLSCDSKAKYTDKSSDTSDKDLFNTIEVTTQCVPPVSVKKGDRVEMAAFYDLEQHPSRPMGGMSGHNMRIIDSSRSTMDGEAEQMAIMVTYFAAKN